MRSAYEPGGQGFLTRRNWSKERGKMEQLGTAKTKIEKGGCYGVRDETGEPDGVNFILIQHIISKNQLCAGSFLSTGIRS